MRIEDVEINKIILPEQVRKVYDPDSIAKLAASIKEYSQLQPCGINPENVLLWGFRRVFALMSLGSKTAKCIRTDRVLSEAEVKAIQLVENLNRSDLTGFEKYMGCVELLGLNPGWQQKDLAEHLHIDPSNVTRIMSLGKCIPPVVESLKAGKLNDGQVYAISKYPEAEQPAALEKALAGATVEKLSRKPRAVREPGASRVTIVLRDAKAVLTGTNLGMAQVVEYLSEMLKEAKKAAETYDVKTWTKMMADKAAL